MNAQSPKPQQAFTLIELMMVLAVIGILVSIALPMYSNYMAKSIHAAGLQEISPGKMQLEINLNEGIGDTNTPENIGLPKSTSHCDIEVSADATTGEATLSCTLKGNAAIIGAVITLKRDAQGVWSCESTARAEFVGASCTSLNT